MILIAKNSDVDILNETTLNRLQDREKTYYSADETFDDDEIHDDSIFHEYLNTIVVSDMSLHHTIIKIEALILLLRNLDPLEKLYNDTRLIITALKEQVIVKE